MSKAESFEVAEDSDLKPVEKQLRFVTTKDDAPNVRVHSEVASVTRSLLHHDEFDVESKRTEDSVVVAVTGTLPLSCLTVKASSRKSQQFNTVVSSGVKSDDEVSE